ncbi:Dyp-type peroxidase [Streptomyces coryli]|uniref:Dyp-type peroxidase n=1 Tax=Streptomyces coryli TaxID=1128680 RepID=UPI0030B8A606
MRILVLDSTRREPEPVAALRHLLRSIERLPTSVAVGVGIGASWFTEGRARSLKLAAMPGFAGDVPDPRHTHGDVLVQFASSRQSPIAEAAESLRGAMGSGWRVRWQLDGFRPDNRAEGGRGLARNPFHFSEGFGNPDSERETRQRVLIRADQGLPEWSVGGSFQVVRIVQLATELWDADSVKEQEQLIGRRRDGRWLDGTPADERPDFATDPKGRMTPLDSHVRLAAPNRRRPPPIVRRSYSYDRGNGDTGLIFSCFQRDLRTGFEAVQKRLEHEAMAKYLLTTGGGYFFVPPTSPDWLEKIASK